MSTARRYLLASLFFCCPAIHAETFIGGTSDDVWVYPNALDPSYDAIGRVWGNGSMSYIPSWPPTEDTSYTYLKFNMAGIAPGHYVVTGAALTVTHRVTSSGTFTRELGIANPLEARALSGTFSEPTWAFANPNNPYPQARLFGLGNMNNYNPSASFPITIDMSNPTFQAEFNAAVNSGAKSLQIALTTKMPVSGQVGALPYRVLTRDYPVLDQQPKLLITYKKLSGVGVFNRVWPQ